MHFCVGFISAWWFINLETLLCSTVCNTFNVYQAFNFRKIKHLFMVSARFCDIYFTLQTCMSSSCILPLSYQNNIVYNMPYFFNNCFWKLNIIWKYCMTLSMMRWEMRENIYEDCSHQNCFWYDAPRGSPGYRYTLGYRIMHFFFIHQK